MIYLAFYKERSHYEAVVQPLPADARPMSAQILGQKQPQPAEGHVSFTGFVEEARAAGVLVNKPTAQPLSDTDNKRVNPYLQPLARSNSIFERYT